MENEYNKIDYWIETAEYDLETARTMQRGSRWLYVGYMCHQAVEKMLKAVYVKKKSKIPPYSHNLKELIDKSVIEKELTPEQMDLIAELTPLNIEARYPAYREKLHGMLDEKKGETIIKRTEALCEWLRKNILQ